MKTRNYIGFGACGGLLLAFILPSSTSTILSYIIGASVGAIVGYASIRIKGR